MCELLKIHEISSNHMIASCDWVEAKKRLNLDLRIDAEHQRVLAEHTKHWPEVLERLMAITLFVAENNLAFEVRPTCCSLLITATSCLWSSCQGGSMIECGSIYDVFHRRKLVCITAAREFRMSKSARCQTYSG